MSKIRLAIFFGGSSEEREVSYMSAKNILAHIDINKYDLKIIGFDKNDSPFLIEKLDAQNTDMLFDLKETIGYPMLSEILQDIDVVFPLIHGPRGEDGELQGYLKKQNVKFVGCGITSSAICMDKKISKLCFKSLGIDVVEHIDLNVFEFENIYSDRNKLVEEVESKLKYPIFVKPANMGSSVGITKVNKSDELVEAVVEAFKFDNHVLIEQGVVARELECAVIGNYDAIAMSVGEILPSKDFYDYEAKYSADFESGLKIPADISDELKVRIQEISKNVYEKLGLRGFSRIDFLYDENEKLFLNEINTIPGFTKYSMFPMLCKDCGIEYGNLVDKLIEYALE